MQTIRLVVFNEDYWDNNLIYTQNILPLKKLADSIGGELELYSFTSLPIYLIQRRIIKAFVSKMSGMNVRVVNKCVLFYPTRYMLPHFCLLPFLFLNVFFYMKALCRKDKNKVVINNLRSYTPALAFYKYYERRDNVFFDPRTEWIEECINAGYFKPNGKTVRYWKKKEVEFVRSFRKTILISDVFKDNLVSKCGVENANKMVVLYNPIDYSKFDIQKKPHKGKVFLYTGSLGHWNNLATYLDFYKLFKQYDGEDNRLVICTNTSQQKVEEVLNQEEYSLIKDDITVHYNVPGDMLPEYYSECDYGLQLMSLPDSRVGVKYVEYVAAGLIPIVNSNVKGAALLSDKYGFGPVIKINDTNESVIGKVLGAKEIDRLSPSYCEFKTKTDLNTIETNLQSIYIYD